MRTRRRPRRAGTRWWRRISTPSWPAPRWARAAACVCGRCWAAAWHGRRAGAPGGCADEPAPRRSHASAPECPACPQVIQDQHAEHGKAPGAMGDLLGQFNVATFKTSELSWRLLALPCLPCCWAGLRMCWQRRARARRRRHGRPSHRGPVPLPPLPCSSTDENDAEFWNRLIPEHERPMEQTEVVSGGGPVARCGGAGGPCASVDLLRALSPPSPTPGTLAPTGGPGYPRLAHAPAGRRDAGGRR